jgi:hypothetical protein
MALKKDIGKQRKVRYEDFINISFDTEEFNVKGLMDRGYTKQHAEDLVRKKWVEDQFKKYPK